MSDRILDVWRLLWPDGMPAEEYEKALNMARLVNIAAAPPGKSAPPDEAVTTQEAARELGVTVNGVLGMVKRGGLRAFKVGSRLAIRRTDLAEFLKTYRKRRSVHAKATLAVVSAGEPSNETETLSGSAAARELGVTSSTIHYAVAKGALAATRTGDTKRAHMVIRRADFEEFKKTYKKGGRA